MVAITERPPRGGLREEFAGAPRVLLLTLAEIERFEDARRGILGFQEDMHLPGRSPKMAEVADFLILALIGGGMDEVAATAAVRSPLPEDARRQLAIARALVGVTLEPDLYDEVASEDGDDAPSEDDDAEKAHGDG